MELNCRTTGTVTEVKRLWWIKVNTKPIRKHALDGARFPHTIAVKYEVNGIEYIKKAYVSVKKDTPPKNAEVAVYYNETKPSKCKVEF